MSEVLHAGRYAAAGERVRHVLVMDRCRLTGPALCDLAAEAVWSSGHRHVTTLSDLSRALSAAPARQTLVVTELFSDSEPLSVGLSRLADLLHWRAPGVRVMVCTDITEPLLLRLVLRLFPSVLALRGEPLSTLQAVMRDCVMPQSRTRVSPAVTALLARSPAVRLTPRETEWLLTQADGLSLQASADRMQVSYKTATAMRYSVMHRLGDSAMAFARRMAVLRGQTGFPAGGSTGYPHPGVSFL